MSLIQEPFRRRTAGRIRIAPWFLATVAIFVSFTAVRLVERSRPGAWRSNGSTPSGVVEVDHAKVRSTGWSGGVELALGGRLVALVVPYHRRSELETFRSASLRERFGLTTGELFRVQLTRTEVEGTAAENAPSDLLVRGLELRDADGEALVDLGRLVGADETTAAPARVDATDPLLVLMARTEIALAAGDMRQVAAWGRAPTATPELIVQTGDGELTLSLDVTDVADGEVPRWFSRVTSMEVALDARDRRISTLEAAVEELKDDLRQEKLDHVRFVQEMSQLSASVPDAGESDADANDFANEATSEEPNEAPDPALVRAEEIGVALRALFKVSGYYGLDLLNAGTVIEDGIGPVLFRMVDDRGRTMGSLAAELLRAEASRSARTLTIVLEDGYESHDGVRVPFNHGVRRISIHIEPDSWIERVPELFDDEDRDPSVDDGIWVHGMVRTDLNRLLGLDTSAGWYRVHSFAGIDGDEFIDTHLEEFDADGYVRRRLFADRMRIDLRSTSVVLRLEGGATIRGDARDVFRDGRYEIHLPRAPVDEWRQASLPGIDAPEREESEAREGQGG